MRKIIPVLIMITAMISTANAGKHQAGTNNTKGTSCFYDSNPGHGKWWYYFCGNHPDLTCAKKRSHKSGDKPIKKYDLETFTFETSPTDSYCCCGGTNAKSGIFVKADPNYGCFTEPIEKAEKRITDLGDGTACTSYIRKTVCGADAHIQCTEPDGTCDATQGQIMRNGTCAYLCTGANMAYESHTSGTCVSCPLTAYQGRVQDYRGSNKSNKIEGVFYCLKCNSTTEFFDSVNEECVSKNDPRFAMVSTTSLALCWRCPLDKNKECIIQAEQRGRQNMDPAIKSACFIQ